MIYYNYINSKEFKNDIKLKLFQPKKIKGIMIACHGLGSNKESLIITKIGEELIKNNVMLVTFDFPKHGENNHYDENLTVNKCINYIEIVRKFIIKKYNNENIGIIGISYGAYIALLEINKNNYNYSTIVMITPAISMKNIFEKHFLKDEMQIFQKNGFTNINTNRIIKIDYEFYDELAKNNLYKVYNKNKEMLIIHANDDNISIMKDTIDFMKINTNAKIKKITNCKHRIQDENIDKVVKILTCYIRKFL